MRINNDELVIQMGKEVLLALGWQNGDGINVSVDSDGSLKISNITKERIEDKNLPYNDVATFMEAAGQNCYIGNDQPEMAALYLKLIKEEYQELIDAIEANDPVEELDAIFDTIWVLIGRARARGFDFKGAWLEGARSNLAKIDEATGKCIKREDGKILKPEGWTEPNFKPYTGV